MTFPGFSSIQNSAASSAQFSPAQTASAPADASFAELALGLINPPASAVSAPPASSAIGTRSPLTLAAASPVSNAPVPSDTAPIAEDSPMPVGPVASGGPVTLSPSQIQSMFSVVLTPGQYLHNVMASIQAGSPNSGTTTLTVAQTLRQALANNYSTPENPYAVCSDPAAAAALVAQVAGANANLLVPTAAGMGKIPTAPAGWVGNYTIGYTTQSSGFTSS